ncbi:hypothetical protein BQ8420_28480 [Nocardiopsis sp. JB363]|nr:hypothetical protein BQ8420_28480 [Nocardiopsis sp. JB363]
MTVHARAQASRRQAQDAVALGESVLDTVPSGSLRATTHGRLRSLVDDLGGHPSGGPLAERISLLN